ncbi:MAG TPA: TetR/AcrR family transcriptional regulator [Actinomycetaceae bacterium]|nr:TetR/AcrR family transcriptional regulator [Actinomycetaceae bacterium]
MSAAPVASTERRILEAAESCFLRFGIAKVTMDNVAQQADVSRATLYRYFRDRDTLIEASVRRRNEHFVRRSHERLAQYGTFAERLEEGLCEDIRRAHDDSVARILTTAPRLTSPQSGHPTLAAEMALEIWEPILQEARTSGELREDLDFADIADWLSRLELMFVSQFGDDQSAFEQIRSYTQKFIVPALVAGAHDHQEQEQGA